MRARPRRAAVSQPVLARGGRRAHSARSGLRRRLGSQRRAVGRSGILSLLAGGSASDATQAIVAKHGVRGLAHALEWLGAPHGELTASRQIVWEQDPFARGGYAYFDPAFDPALRAWLARPAGRLFFAGEHTSIRWQGYMNGAVESGRRAAAEVAATHA